MVYMYMISDAIFASSFDNSENLSKLISRRVGIIMGGLETFPKLIS